MPASPNLARVVSIAVLLATPALAQVRAMDLEWLRNAGARFDGTALNHKVGHCVAAAGDVNADGVADWLVGAPQVGLDVFSDPPGTVYLFYGAPGVTTGGAVTGADVILVGEDNGWKTGYAAAGAGDVNGDGYGDLVIGAYGAKTNNNTSSGRGYVVYGGLALAGTVNLATLTASQGMKINGAQTSDLLGEAVAAAGDVDGDGLPDVLIGARGEGSAEGATGRGAAYLLFGDVALPALLEIEAPGSVGVTKFIGVSASDKLGDAVAGVGDVDADGYDDLLLGAQDAPSTGTHGAAYLVWGDPLLPASMSLSTLGAAGVTVSGSSDGDSLGHDVAAAGDVNGDGLADVVVSASGASVSGMNHEGRVYVVYGSASLPASFSASAVGGSVGGVIFNGALGSGATLGDNAGSAVGGGGDANRDGYDDLLIGASSADPNGDLAAGSVYLVYGGPALPGSIALATLGARGVRLDGVLPSDTVGGPSGGAVAFAGDVDDDGFDDLLMGAESADPAGSASGSTWLVKGACHMSQAAGPVVDGGTLNLRAHGTPLVANLTFAALAALPTPIDTKFGPWWLIAQLDLLAFAFDANGEMFLPLALPPAGSIPGLVGLTVHMQTLGAPQGSKCDLAYLLSFTIE
jgi:hypothetical protein